MGCRPVHPSLGKMILLGIIFRCLDSMVILATAIFERNLFFQSLDTRHNAYEARRTFAEGTESDHIATLNAFRAIRRVRDGRGRHPANKFATEHFLHYRTFDTIDSTSHQIARILIEIGLIPSPSGLRRWETQIGDASLNKNSRSVPLIKALLLYGMYPNLGVLDSASYVRTKSERSAMIHPRSINAPQKRGRDEVSRQGTLVVYSSITQTPDEKATFVHDTSFLPSPLSVALFGGQLTARKDEFLEVDGWLPFRVLSEDQQAVKTILEFRKAMDRLLAEAFMDLRRVNLEDGTANTYLADRPSREAFATGLAQVG